MKVIRHGNCLLFVCPECGCEFQASEKESGTVYKTSEDYNTPSKSGFYRSCPECGCESIKGKPAWKKE